MRSSINSLIDYFIPTKLKSPREVYWRARIITSIHLFLLFSVITSELICTLLFGNNEFPHLLSFIGGSILLFIFKKYGSFIVSGNLLVVFLILALLPFSLTTGGIYSYDFLALLIVPILGFLIAGRKSGFLWTAFMLTTGVVFYFLELNASVSYRTLTLQNSASYYLIFISFIYVINTSCVAIFDKGQRLIIGELNAQRDLLKANKIELENKEIELLESNQSLKHFAHVASHDLKQPIRTIYSFGQLLQRDIGADLSKNHQMYLDFIISGSKQLQNQIDSVMNHAKIGKSKLEDIETIETLSFVENIILKLQRQIIDTDVKVIIKKLPTEIVASRIELGLVFQNIISNAIKFKKSDTPLSIEIAGNEQPDFFEFKISDNGVGVEPDIIGKIFTPMVKSYSKQNAEGTGMGLATCEKIVKRHQGTIKVTSEEGEGAIFTFTIGKQLKVNMKKLEFGLEELVA